MARRYDSQTTTFSPEGRLYQVEYAIAAIQNAATAVGVQCRHGVVLACERKVSSPLLAPPKSSEKMYTIDEHIFAAVAGLTSDANILIAQARLAAQRYRYTYGEAVPLEYLVTGIADYKHSYTQYGGLRPFGCAFLFAGWDRHFGWQIYSSDPSGNFSGWRATAVGSNASTATGTLKTDWSEELTLEEAKALAVKALVKAMDTASPSSEKIEVSVLTTVEGAPGKFVQRALGDADVDAIIKASGVPSAATTAAPTTATAAPQAAI